MAKIEALHSQAVDLRIEDCLKAYPINLKHDRAFVSVLSPQLLCISSKTGKYVLSCHGRLFGWRVELPQPKALRHVMT